MPSVNSTRRRSSGTFPMFEKPARTLIEPSSSLRCRCRCRSGRYQHGLAAGLRDLLLRALRERMRGDSDGLRELALAEDLDAIDVALDEAALAKRLLVDL